MKKLSGALLCACLTVLLSVPAYASPATGDMGIGMWIILMVVAVIVLVGVLILMKRGKK